MELWASGWGKDHGPHPLADVDLYEAPNRDRIHIDEIEAVGLDMPVGVGGLADARVAELLLDPTQIRAVVTPPTKDARKRPPSRFSPNPWPGPAGERFPTGNWSRPPA